MDTMFMFKELTVYKKAFTLAMEIFEVSKKFPSEEKYDLTSQIRRSSRSVCTSIGEGYRKRHYPAFFISKISDADMENSETYIWTDFAVNCKYISEEIKEKWQQQTHEIGKLLNHMIENPEKYQRQEKKIIDHRQKSADKLDQR
jgi:four helix bundle protein